MGDIEKSPGQQAIATMKQIDKELIFKKPVGIPKRRKNQNVLDEDSYVEVVHPSDSFVDFRLISR